MMTKDQILDEIRKLSDELGRPAGQKMFAKKTGISRTYWEGTYWPKWSAAVEEAGLEANSKNSAISDDLLFASYLQLVEELRKLPSLAEMRFKKKSSPDFPAVITYQKRFGTQRKIASSAYDFAVKTGYAGDALDILISAGADLEFEVHETPDNPEGHVYLLKSGAFYKIGQSSDLEKRIKQISIALPNKVELIHAIRTDDPSGIEAYWHRRFAGNRKNGEWFELTREDVRAFRRRRFQ